MKTHDLSKKRGWWRHALAVSAATAGLAVAAWQLQAEDTVPPGFRSYSLKHASAGEMATQVRQVLARAQGKPEVIIEPKTNSLLIRGGDDAQRLASQLIGALDRPAVTSVANANAAPTESVVRAYRMPQGNADQILDDLRRRFPATTGANLSLHKTTGQLLAIAPPEVQRQLADVLGNATNNRTVAQASATDPAVDNTTVQREHALKNLDWKSFESFMSRIWGDRAKVGTNNTGDIAAFRLRNAAGEEATARVDRRLNGVTFEGSRSTATQWAKLVNVLDGSPVKKTETIQLVPVPRADPADVNEAIELIRAAYKQGAVRKGEQRSAQTIVGSKRSMQASDIVAKIFLQEAQPEPQPMQPPPTEGAEGAEGATEDGPIGPVRIEFLQGLDVVIITGKKSDVARVAKIIQEIQDIGQETKPLIELYNLRNADSTAVGDLVVQLYNEALAPRHGTISITALDKPNSLLFVGRRDSIDAALELVKKLDQPVSPQTQFQVFQLRHMAVGEALRIVSEFFTSRATQGALAPQALVSSDVRTNALIVHASPRDLAEVETMLMKLDVSTTTRTDEVRVVPLKFAFATDLVPVLQAAMTGQGGAAGGANQQNPNNVAPTTGQGTQSGTVPNSSIRFMQIDKQGNKTLQVAMLSEVRVSADTNGNAVLVRGPADSMDLVEALIRELDHLPQSESQIKVFTITNGDATNLSTMLQSLFGQGGGAAGGQQGGGVFNFAQAITASGDNTLVPLRFSVDARTNSIVATGSPGDLSVVEAILIRLDESGLRERKTVVYRLKNSYALDVANAITQFLTSQRQINQGGGTQASPLSLYEQLDREVVVVPEPQTNNLIVSATPRFYGEIEKIVKDLDTRPPMVMIQVTIAEVSLNDFEEFGVELGLQDSLLFDRSVAGVPGFNFNNAALGNNVNANRENVGGQSLTNFALGRSNGNVGYGGLVLSASNESISILIRALQDANRLQVLSRPQIMALDNQQAQILVGQQVPFASGTSTNVGGGITTATQLLPVGLSLTVQPRTSPDDSVMMLIDAEKSSLGPVDQGIVTSIGPDGTAIRQPIINQTRAQTTVIAKSGQTIVLGGLITKTRSISTKRVPYLSDVPLFGRLFRYDAANEERTELLIIMTPHVVRNEVASDMIKQTESDRMSWCLADVVELHGPAGLSGGHGLWGPTQAPVIFPDMDPTGEQPRGKFVPTSEGLRPLLTPHRDQMHNGAPYQFDSVQPPVIIDPATEKLEVLPPGTNAMPPQTKARPKSPASRKNAPEKGAPAVAGKMTPTVSQQIAKYYETKGRSVQSDTATVIYGDPAEPRPTTSALALPPSSALPPPSKQAPPPQPTPAAKPQGNNVAPANYQQPMAPPNGYPVQQSNGYAP